MESKMESKQGLRFGEPKVAHRRLRKYDWDWVYEQLKQNPDQWACLDENGGPSTQVSIRRGKISNFHPDMGVEVIVQNTNLDARPRTAEVWVRYNPDTDVSLTVKQREQARRNYRKKQKENNMEKESD